MDNFCAFGNAGWGRDKHPFATQCKHPKVLKKTGKREIPVDVFICVKCPYEYVRKTKEDTPWYERPDKK